MSDVLQILKGTSARPRVTFYSDGVPTDLDSGVPAVTVTRPDGTTIASGTVSHVGAVGTGTYEFTLAAQASVTFLSVDWAGPIGGITQTITSYVEVVGGFLFTLAALRGMRVAGGYPFATTAVPMFTDAQLLDTRASVLEEFTSYLGFSPVPRFARETHSSSGYGGIVLHQPYATELLSVTVAGTTSAVGGYYLHPAGILRPVSNYLPGTPIAAGTGNVTVEYEHGWPRVEGLGGHRAMLYAAAQLNPSGFSSASTVSMPDGSSYSYEPSEVGRSGFQRFTGIKDVDRWLNHHRLTVAGVA